MPKYFKKIKCNAAFVSSLDILREQRERDRGSPHSSKWGLCVLGHKHDLNFSFLHGVWGHTGSVLTERHCALRCANPATPAQMGHMTATRTPSVTTWATTVTPCTAVSASLAMLATASSVGRTRTLTAGQMRTWCVWPMQLTTAKR